MSSIGGPEIIKEGLILYLDAGNLKSYSGSGQNWMDLISRQSAVAYNSPIFENSHFNFDGASSYFRFERDDINGGSFSYSVSTIYIWVKPSTLLSTSLTSNNILTIENTFEISIGKISSTSPYSGLAYASKPWAWRQVYSNILINDSWNLITYVHKLDGRVVYVNGEVIYTSSDTGGLSSGSSNYPYLTIGGRYSGTGSSLEGSVSSVLIYDNIHTDSDVLKNYNAIKSRYDL